MDQNMVGLIERVVLSLPLGQNIQLKLTILLMRMVGVVNIEHGNYKIQRNIQDLLIFVKGEAYICDHSSSIALTKAQSEFLYEYYRSKGKSYQPMAEHYLKGV